MAAKSSTIYYAHALCTYGWPRESAELRFLRASFPSHRVINPARFKERDMGFYRGFVAESEGLVFGRLGGKITAGVGDEVNHALMLGREVFELVAWNPKFPDWTLRRVVRRVRFLTRDESIAMYRRFESGELIEGL